jgi:enolase
MGAEVFHTLKKELSAAGHCTGVGDEGGFAPEPQLDPRGARFHPERPSRRRATPGEDIFSRSTAPRPNTSRTAAMSWRARAKPLTPSENVAYLAALVADYPIISIEDGCAEDDWDGWRR